MTWRTGKLEWMTKPFILQTHCRIDEWFHRYKEFPALCERRFTPGARDEKSLASGFGWVAGVHALKLISIKGSAGEWVLP